MRKVPSGSNISAGTFFFMLAKKSRTTYKSSATGAFPNFLGNISTVFPHIPHHSLLAQNA